MAVRIAFLVFYSIWAILDYFDYVGLFRTILAYLK